MAAIFQTTFSNAFSLVKMYEFRLIFHWGLFPMVQLTIFQHWFRKWLGAGQATSHYLNQWWLVCWRIYASLGLNELMGHWTVWLHGNGFSPCPYYFDTFGPGKNGWYFADNIFKCKFLMKMCHFFFSTPLQFVPKGPVDPHDLADDRSILVQVMAYCPKSLSYYLKQCWPSSGCYMALLGHNELTHTSLLTRPSVCKGVLYHVIFCVLVAITFTSHENRGLSNYCQLDDLLKSLSKLTTKTSKLDMADS